MTEPDWRHSRTMPPCTVIPVLVYDDVTAAVAWLGEVFGFVERWHAGDHRAQLTLGDSTIVVTEPASRALAGPRSLVVRVADVDAHRARVGARGGRVIAEPQDFPYGERQYTVEDPGGHRWTFSESRADMAPEEWGGTSGAALREDRKLGPAVPEGTGAAPPQISVMLIVDDADRAIAWYREALGAAELWNLGGVAGLEVAGAPFFVHAVNPENPLENSPIATGATTTRVEVFVDDPDGFIARAAAAGAAAEPVREHPVPWGIHRQGGFRDPFGHRWAVGDRSPLAATVRSR